VHDYPPRDRRACLAFRECSNASVQLEASPTYVTKTLSSNTSN
jgi:hypothetical protein